MILIYTSTSFCMYVYCAGQGLATVCSEIGAKCLDSPRPSWLSSWPSTSNLDLKQLILSISTGIISIEMLHESLAHATKLQVAHSAAQTVRVGHFFIWGVSCPTTQQHSLKLGWLVVLQPASWMNLGQAKWNGKKEMVMMPPALQYDLWVDPLDLNHPYWSVKKK